MSAQLEPDRDQIERFVNALFMHAGEGGTVSLRVFFDDELAKKRKERAYKIRPVKLNGDGREPVIDLAARLAQEAGELTRATVVCPPVATFQSGKAEEKNVLEGLVILVEMDQRAAAGVANLREIIGRPTIVVASGGLWLNPETGELEPKQHAYWRLAEPTQTPEEHARLKRARELACKFVGGDASAVALAHPIRWAGTWHRKNLAEPRRAEIIEYNPDAEIILEDALAELEGLETLRDSYEHQPDDGKAYTTTADDDLLLACAERIPNPDLDWHAWNRIGMAFYRASGGSDVGFKAFDVFSRKSTKCVAGGSNERWESYTASPPDRLTVGTLIYEARKGDPDFLSFQPEAPAAIELDLDALPAQLREAIEADPKLVDSWAKGTKLTRGEDASDKGLEFSLVVYLAGREHDDNLIELAVRHYPHGQIGSGKIKGENADRRLNKLLEKAEGIRARAKRRQGSREWYGDLQTSEEGVPRDCLANGSTILNKDPAFAGKIRFDEHRGAPLCHDMPWRAGDDWREWSNTDDIRFAEWCQTRGVPLRPTTCADAVMAVADDNRFHPIRDYLDELAWDGVPRLDGWLETYLSATVPDGKTEEEQATIAARRAYICEAGRRWLISAVARIYRPGCKADCALILEGPQGIGKSSTLAALVPRVEWFSDEISDLGSKDSAQDLRGKWIIELAELSAMKRGDIERTKAFMSRAIDHYRPSYGRRSQDFPRQCVFAGTTNAETYLGDETGNRRFWPVKVGHMDLAGLRQVRDQLWAEAVAAFKAGEKWWLTATAEEASAEEQATRRIVDPWEEPLLEWAGRQVNPASIPEALTALSVPVERHDQINANRVARIFRAAGWEKTQRRVGGKPRWVYCPPGVSQVSQVAKPPPGWTCDSQVTEKATASPPVTGVIGVTGNCPIRKGQGHHPGGVGELDYKNNGGGGVPAENFLKNGCDTRDTCDSQGKATHPGGQRPSRPSFVPTAEWQEVPDGAVLPPGCEIRMDMSGGPKLARLMPEPAEFEL